MVLFARIGHNISHLICQVFDFIAEGNDFDKDKAKADAMNYLLPKELAAIDMAELEASFYVSAIN